MPKEYLSNYEWKCAKCGQPIKPRTPYHMSKGDRGFKRTHVNCPDIAGRTKGKPPVTSD